MANNKPKDKPENKTPTPQEKLLSTTPPLEPVVKNEPNADAGDAQPEAAQDDQSSDNQLDEKLEETINISTVAESNAIILNTEIDKQKLQELMESWNPCGVIVQKNIPEEMGLVALNSHLNHLARKAERNRQHALAAEFHNALAALGMALNKIKEFTPEALKFFEED